MRWVRPFVVVGMVFVVLLTSAVGAIAKSGAFKTGTYNLKPPGYTVTLKHAQCGGKPQLCVALPKSPAILCSGPADATLTVGNFATPAALPSSGKITQHATSTQVVSALGPGTPAQTVQSAFSIAFKKNGTASGYVEVGMTVVVGNQPVPCSGKVRFTAKLA